MSFGAPSRAAMLRAASALAALLLAAANASADAGKFDFYVLALSWSPTYCATAAGARDSEECRAGRHLGFILHGLWPQDESGYPRACGPAEPLAPDLIRSLLDIMPDAGLVAHEWKTHGTCSGLSPEAYFAAARSAFAKVAIPAAFSDVAEAGTVSADSVEAEFVAANPGLRRGGIAISCGGGYLEDVRICMTRDLAFRDCQEVDADGCRRSGLRLPPMQ